MTDRKALALHLTSKLDGSWSRTAEDALATTDLIAQMRATVPQDAANPVRTIHHFACTGGTLISRFLAATPNARLLSEIDPLSPIVEEHFSPLDLALQYRNANPIINVDDQIAIFLAGLKAIHERVIAHGERLIIRDHAHSHFCTGPNIPNRPTLKQIIAPHYPLLSVVTVRHPLDSYLSVLHNKFTHFTPLSLETYATRYMAFLDAYTDETIVKYEDFITNHAATIDALCACLALPNSDDLHDIAPAINLTGDSGRSGITLEVRDRRDVPAEIKAMCKSSKTYKALCRRLDYPT